MEVDPAAAAGHSVHDGVNYSFCSKSCQAKFEADPDRYLRSGDAGSHQAHGGVTVADIEATAIDPVCGMTVETATAEYRSFRDGKAYYFCSSGCKESFDKEPEKYLKAPGTHRH